MAEFAIHVNESEEFVHSPESKPASFATLQVFIQTSGMHRAIQYAF